MSNKDALGQGPNQPPPSSGAPSDLTSSGPVDLVTKPPTVAQIRIPSITSQLRSPHPAIIPPRNPSPGGAPRPSPALLTPSGTLVSSMPRGQAISKALPGSNITMLPQPGGKVTVVHAPGASLPQVSPSRSAGPIQTLTTIRPISGKPIVSRPTITTSMTQPRSSAPLVRSQGVAVSYSLPLRAPGLPQAPGSIRLATAGSGPIQWVHTSQSLAPTPPTVRTQSTRPLAVPLSAPRAPALFPAGTRAVTMTMAAFRPTATIMTTRPTLISPSGGGDPVRVTLVQTGHTKSGTIVTQNPMLREGTYKPVTSLTSGQSLAIRPPTPGSTVRVQSGPTRVSVVGPSGVNPPIAVSLTPATHITVPIVPGASGPPVSKSRVAVAAPGIQKLISTLPVGVAGQVSMAPVQQLTSSGAGSRTISLPFTPAKQGAPPTSTIPIARVPPQPLVSRAAGHELSQQQQTMSVGSNVFLPTSSRQQQEQQGPVNLAVDSRGASTAVFSHSRAPAMTLPNFSQTTFLYDSSRSDQQNSVTITTLPVPSEGSGHPPSSGHGAPAPIQPARITPILPSQPVEPEKIIPGSPRPSILRKREGEGTPIKGTQLLAPAMSPGSPQRPDSSGSSTISATSSHVLSGDEQALPSSSAVTQMMSSGPNVISIPGSLPMGASAVEVSSNSSTPVGPSPRKKPRKQAIHPRESGNSISPEWAAVKRELGARDRAEWGGGKNWERKGWEGSGKDLDGKVWEGSGKGWEGSGKGWEGMGGLSKSWDQMSASVDQADDEDESTDEEREVREKQLPSVIGGRPHISLLNSYRHTWKSRHNHFLRHSDVRAKDERRPTVNELANQKYVSQKVNGWKLYHLSAGMEDTVDMEAELSNRLHEFGRRIEAAAGKDGAKEAVKVQELIKANMQRSKVIQDQIREARDNVQNIFEHKNKILDIITKYQSKRSLKGRREN